MKTLKGLRQTAVVAVLASVGLGSTSMANPMMEEKAAEISYRQGLFKQVKASVGTVRTYLKGGDVPGGEAGLLDSVKALVEATSHIDEAFKTDTTGMAGKTAALPAIWQNYDDFSARADKFHADTKALLSAVEQGGNIGGALRGVFSNCKGCHDKYKD